MSWFDISFQPVLSFLSFTLLRNEGWNLILLSTLLKGYDMVLGLNLFLYICFACHQALSDLFYTIYFGLSWDILIDKRMVEQFILSYTIWLPANQASGLILSIKDRTWYEIHNSRICYSKVMWSSGILYLCGSDWLSGFLSLFNFDQYSGSINP